MLTSQVMNLKLKAERTWNDRVSGLLIDGYKVVFTSSGISSDWWLASLLHHNGNRVVLTAYWKTNRLIQRTNGRVTHEGTLY